MNPYSNFQPVMPTQYPSAYPQQQIQNPYMDRLSQLQAMQQSYQPQPQFVGLNGKVVDSMDSIMANEVPMDGTFAVFPKRDMSEVCIKYWTGEGKIATVLFKPVLETEPNIYTPDTKTLRFDEVNDALEGIYEKVNNLASQLDDMLKPRNSQRSKKEVNANE